LFIQEEGTKKVVRYFTIITMVSSSSDPVCGPILAIWCYTIIIWDDENNKVNTSYNFTRLTPGSNFTVTMAGINMAGIGKSNKITVSTLN